MSHSSSPTAPLQLTRAPDTRRFLDDPTQSYLTGPGWLTLCAAEHLWLCSLWGSPSTEDLIDMEASLSAVGPLQPVTLPSDRQQPRPAAGGVWILDCSQLRGLRLEDAASLLSKVRGTLERHRFLRYRFIPPPWLADTLRALAPTAVPGAWHAELPAALGDFPADWGAEILTLHQTLSQASAAVTQLRRLLADDLGNIDLRAAAQHFGWSTRSLQRHLNAAGTSFREELRQARINAAKALLSLSRESVLRLAARLGYASSESFIREFRKTTGTTPGAFRRVARTTSLPQPQPKAARAPGQGRVERTEARVVRE